MSARSHCRADDHLGLPRLDQIAELAHDPAPEIDVSAPRAGTPGARTSSTMLSTWNRRPDAI